MVFIWRCALVQLAAKGEGGLASAVAPTVDLLGGNLLLAVVVAVYVIVVKATSLGRGLMNIWAVILLPSPAFGPLHACECVCGCGHMVLLLLLVIIIIFGTKRVCALVL